LNNYLHFLTAGSLAQSKKGEINLRNPHLWIILGISLICLVFYYTRLSELRNILWLWTLRDFEIRYSLNGLLLYIPFIYATIVFGWLGITLIWLITMAPLLPKIIYWGFNFPSIFSNLLFLTSPVLIVIIITLISRWLRKEKEIFREKEAARQSFLSQMLKAQEDERKRIAQVLHDDTIQALLSLAQRMRFLSNNENNNLEIHTKQEITTFSDSVYSVTKDLRRICVDLRPSILDDLGLLEATRSLVEKHSDETFKARINVQGTIRRLSPEVEETVYRFIQEALNNIQRHARASEATIDFSFELHVVKIKVQDNGIGFTLPKSFSDFSKDNKLGLLGMQERASMLGGNFVINSQSGEGTQISLEFKV
jgi:two-component system, NarL family, sensor histidine kinase DegS